MDKTFFDQYKIMNPFVKLWFWLLIMSIIGYLIAFASFEALGEASSYSEIPIWIWIVFALSFIASIAALILYSVEAYREIKQRKADIACGRIPAPEPEKIACPVDPVFVQTPCGGVTAIQPPPIIVNAPSDAVMNPAPIGVPVSSCNFMQKDRQQMIDSSKVIQMTQVPRQVPLSTEQISIPRVGEKVTFSSYETAPGNYLPVIAL